MLLKWLKPAVGLKKFDVKEISNNEIMRLDMMNERLVCLMKPPSELLVEKKRFICLFWNTFFDYFKHTLNTKVRVIASPFTDAICVILFG